MTFCSNHEYGLVRARLLTAVGLFRASIGPPIIIMVLRQRLLVARPCSETAASTGTVGWHTEITCRSGDEQADPLAHVVARSRRGGTARR